MPLREVIGHRRVRSQLSQAIARETLPPSLLFVGPEGVGKQATALAVAQTLVCQQPAQPAADAADRWPLAIDACGVCRACRRAALGTLADVRIVRRGETGAIKIEQVREIVDLCAYRPFEARRRAVIIDDADAMAPPAQNALLKTLEEPPSATVFMLVTPRPDTLQPTVVSRCPKVRFGRLSDQEIADALKSAHGWAPADATAAALVAGGSLGRALAMQSDEGIAALDAARRALAIAARSLGAKRLEAAAALSSGAGKRRERDHLSDRLRALAALLRDLQATAVAARPQWIVHADLRGDLDRLAADYGRDRAARAYAAVHQALDALDRNVSAKAVADWVALQL
jgi:DNA polymerase-3 subunit delta'